MLLLKKIKAAYKIQHVFTKDILCSILFAGILTILIVLACMFASHMMNVLSIIS